MVEARYDRLHTTIVKYYQHCKEHRAYVMAGIARLLKFGVGTEESYDVLPPVLSTQHGYRDYEPPSVPVLSSVYQRSYNSDIEIWNSYTQHLTAQHVSIDATHRVAKKVNNASYTRLFTCVIDGQLPTLYEPYPDLISIHPEFCRSGGEVPGTWSPQLLALSCTVYTISCTIDIIIQHTQHSIKLLHIECITSTSGTPLHHDKQHTKCIL